MSDGRVLTNLDEPVDTGPADQATIYLASRREGLKAREQLLRALDWCERLFSEPISRIDPAAGAPAPYTLDAGIGGRPSRRFTTGQILSGLADAGVLKLTASGEADLIASVRVWSIDLEAQARDRELGGVLSPLFPALGADAIQAGRTTADDASRLAKELYEGTNNALTAGIERVAWTVLIIVGLVLAGVYFARRLA